MALCNDACLARIVADMSAALGALSNTPSSQLPSLATPGSPTPTPEEMATQIRRGMAGGYGRAYHATPHVFELYDATRVAETPLAAIAALFHDLVYLGTDGGVAADAAAALTRLGCLVAAAEPCAHEQARATQDEQAAQAAEAADVHEGEAQHEDDDNHIDDSMTDTDSASASASPASTSAPSTATLSRASGSFVARPAIVTLSGGGVQLPTENLCPLLAMACSVFGQTPGACVQPGPGTNEFLSAVVALDALGAQLSAVDALAVTLLIEATVPFRDHTYLDDLRARVSAWATADMPALADYLAAQPSATLLHFLGLNDPASECNSETVDAHLAQHCSSVDASRAPDALGAMLAGGVLLAQRDVSNFCAADSRVFLVNAWRLLPENCPALRGGFGHARMADIRGALAATLGFYGFLPAERVFHPCPGAFTPAAHAALTVAAARNLAIGRAYVGAALVASAAIEALAHISGGDAPGLAALLHAPASAHGALRDDTALAAQAANLDDVTATTQATPEDVARATLARGRHTVSGVLAPCRERGDVLTPSALPVAAHVAQRLATAGTTAQAIAAAQAFGRGEIEPTTLLDVLPTATVKCLAQILAAFSPARAVALVPYTSRRPAPLHLRSSLNNNSLVSSSIASAVSSAYASLDMGYVSHSPSPTASLDGDAALEAGIAARKAAARLGHGSSHTTVHASGHGGSHSAHTHAGAHGLAAGPRLAGSSLGRGVVVARSITQ